MGTCPKCGDENDGGLTILMTMSGELCLIRYLRRSSPASSPGGICPRSCEKCCRSQCKIVASDGLVNFAIGKLPIISCSTPLGINDPKG